MTPRRRLRVSTSARTASARRRRIAHVVVSSPACRSSGSRRAKWVSDRRSADREGFGSTERRLWDTVKAAYVEVVDGLLDEIGQVLDKRHVVFDVAGDAETCEHVPAEAVCCRDRRGVEGRDRLGEPTTADFHLGLGAVAQQCEDAVVGGRRHTGERARESELGADEPIAYPLTQLARRHPREGDDEKPLTRDAFGDQPCDQRGDRVRLPRPRARLEQRHASWQRPAQVELAHPARRAHRSISSSRARSPSQSRRAYRPARDGSSGSQPSPCSSSRGRCSNNSATVRVPPSTRRCSGSTSSLG